LAGWLAGGEGRFEVADRKVIVIAAVADPVSVARFAECAGLSPTIVVAFPDHHRFTEIDIAALLVKHRDVPFVVTEKDAIKCRPEWFGDRPVGVLRRRRPSY
jgi:tetraacyldisaccharide-1-P 4'-kinase